MDDQANGNAEISESGEIARGGEIPRLKELADFRFHLRQFLSFSESASERYGIQAQQYQLLQVVGSVPAGQAASISYIAERMILRHNSTVELVDRAERAGLVSRHTDERDLRRSIIRLTPHGHELLAKMVPEHLQELARHTDRLIEMLRAVNPPAEGNGGPPPGVQGGDSGAEVSAASQ
ncbi:MAG TPA: MarR family winged helix-turn-helix transcriptional regulator [Acidobacteriaceae bacterium]|jgi:DNA-binding MarR family transcriptional regulator|nr:MarR family winged helix-turn-helix transcriptional regulator [Acidobacteriaceae bacterium]